MQTVFHVSSDDPADRRHAMVNVSNLLDDESVASTGDDVTIVANGAGVRMVVAGTAEHPEMVSALHERGVALLACGNSLASVGAADSDLLSGVERVPAGVGALARLQDEGYGYVKTP